MKVHILPRGRVVKEDRTTVELLSDDGETAIFLRPTWEKLAQKQWGMEDAYVHIPWQSVPEALPLACRLWLYLWRQRSMQPNEDVVVRQSMLAQWGFNESKETIRKAVWRMATAGLLKVISNGRKQLRVTLIEPRPASSGGRQTVHIKAASEEFLGATTQPDVQL